MNEPTPLTDALYDKIIDGPLHAIGPTMRNHARDLEEQLAAHRAALAKAETALAGIIACEDEARGGAGFLDRIFPAVESARDALAAIRELTAKGGRA